MNRLSLCAVLCIALLFSGCAANRIVSSWSDPATGGRIASPTLVFGVTHQQTVRRLFEDAFTAALAGQNAASVASYTVMANKGRVEYADIVAEAGRSGAATVLVTRLEDRETSSVDRLATGGVYDTLDRLEEDALFFNPAPKVASSSTTRLYLQSRLYDVPSRKLLWSAVTEAKDPVMTMDFFADLAELLAADLRKSGLLQD